LREFSTAAFHVQSAYRPHLKKKEIAEIMVAQPANSPPVSIQFYLPKAVAESLDLVARRIPYVTALDREHRGQVRVTTTVETAAGILELVRAGGAKEEGPAVIAYAAAAKNLIAAIDAAIGR